MKIGIMNNPSSSIYNEIIEIGEAGFDFLDLTIEGPDAMNIDIVRVSELINQYNLSVVGHTDPCLPYAYPSLGIRVACLNDLEKCA
ncbi:MAG: sugar phosphate isomerase/epimerase, partial [Spirochaetota bacterium]|nr:sugar phosphate isomerase/epimerase [Spirochaetota bacterium]